MLAPFSVGLAALLPFISIPVRNALIGMVQMAAAEGNPQEWEQNAAQCSMKSHKCQGVVHATYSLGSKAETYHSPVPRKTGRTNVTS